MSKIEFVALFSDITTYVKNFYNYIWLFFEIHMRKIIFISVMLLCVNDVSLNRIEDVISVKNLFKFYSIKLLVFQVCAINLIFVLISVIMINFRRSVQICTVNIVAAIIGILMVGKMLYQIQYINHSNWDINCTVT